MTTPAKSPRTRKAKPSVQIDSAIRPEQSAGQKNKGLAVKTSGQATGNPAEILRKLMTDGAIKPSERISAAAALARIERGDGTRGGSGLHRLSRDELQAEIAAIRALIGTQVTDTTQ